MIQDFFFHLGQNFGKRRPETVQVILALLGAILLVWFLLNAMLWIGLFGLFIGAFIVLGASLFLPRLAWFWGPLARATAPPEKPQPSEPEASGLSDSMASEHVADDLETPTSEDEAEHIPIPDPETIIHGAPKPTPPPVRFQHMESVRQYPQGTRLVRQTSDEAVFEVKSIVQFWGAFLPPLFTLLTIFGTVPIGLLIIAMLASSRIYNVEGQVFLFTALTFIGLSIWSFVTTRPWVRVTVTPEAIRYGDRTFDRRHHYGMQVGYGEQGAQLPNGFFGPRFGVTLIRLTYGSWGEDLRYMVNAYHAEEIVIWMNRIIDSVGAPPPPNYDPFMGRKVELL